MKTLIIPTFVAAHQQNNCFNPEIAKTAWSNEWSATRL
jgi:hypothetical protein